MTKKINALRARQNFGGLLNRVFYKNEEIIIERAGKEMAVVIPIEIYKKWQEEKKTLLKAIKQTAQRLNTSYQTLIELINKK